MSQPSPTRHDLWRQYQTHVDLYKHYLELTLKLNVFYYAVTGAIVSFYLSRHQPGVLKYVLVLPVVMGLGFALLFIFGGVLNLISRWEVKRLVGALGLMVYPEFWVLSILLWLSATLFSIVAAGLGFLLCKGDALFTGGATL